MKLVDRATIAAHDWSLTPGRYVGVRPRNGRRVRGGAARIHIDLKGLNEEAAELWQASVS